MTAGALEAPLLRTEGLTRHFRLGGLLSRRMLHAVDDVDLEIRQREVVALVGESGSGKSTVARLLARLYRPTRGRILFHGEPVDRLRSRAASLGYHGQVAMVFQDPYSSLNPAFRVSHGVTRALRLHRPELSPDERQHEAERLFTIVGLTPAAATLRRFPYELSGGQRQRVGFAEALASKPSLILADEPVSMLDVSIRAGILNLMTELRDREGVSMLFITHDIASARYVADRIVVMYGGHVVESGPSEAVVAHPRHPYAQLLMASVPDPRTPPADLVGGAVGDPPKVIDPIEGCRFVGRCPVAIEICSRVTPRLRELGPGHSAACHVAVADS
ncbi:MAG TPA: ABC transporter ATP-binding protein [Candidatus Limnocylindrales bacterium]|nr:ABC transporter ATP-binding protein [Candidatus Limnocylindrales bacterium]